MKDVGVLIENVNGEASVLENQWVWSAVAQQWNAGLTIDRARVRIPPLLPFRSLGIFVLSTTPQ